MNKLYCSPYKTPNVTDASATKTTNISTIGMSIHAIIRPGTGYFSMCMFLCVLSHIAMWGGARGGACDIRSGCLHVGGGGGLTRGGGDSGDDGVGGSGGRRDSDGW